MPDASPILLRRLVSLRQFPIFDGVELDELATLGENLRSVTLPAGTVIAASGERPGAISLVLEGTIAEPTTSTRWHARQTYGGLEVFAARPVSAMAIALTDVRALQLRAGDVAELLEDNFTLLGATLQALAGAVLSGPAVLPRRLRDLPNRLGLVERLLVLREQLPFARTRLPALTALAQASQEVELNPGRVLAREGETATSAQLLLDGEVTVTGGPTRVAEPGAGIGYLEVLAGQPYAATVAARTKVRALRCTASALLDVIEDHTDLGLAIVTALSAELLDRAARAN